MKSLCTRPNWPPRLAGLTIKETLSRGRSGYTALRNMAIEEVQESIQRRAMEIVSLPEAERESKYALYRETYMEAASQLGSGKDERWADFVD